MDPLSAIGLASAVVQFVALAVTVVQRLSEYTEASSGEVPKSLQAICIQLPLLINALGRMQNEDALASLDFNTRCILRGVVMGCLAQIQEVEAIAKEIAMQPGDSMKVRLRKVFVSLKRDDKVWEIERNLHTYISVLILHHVVDSADVPPVLSEEGTFFDVREEQVAPLVEREPLLRKLDALFYDASRSLTTRPVIVFMIGAAQVGKTQLALRYCHRAHHLSQFRTIFWLDASTPETLALSLEGVSATITRSTHGSREEKLAGVKKFLAGLWHPWLLVLDNHDPSAFRQTNIMDFLPSTGYGAIIVIVGIEHFITWPSILEVPKFVKPEDQARLDDRLKAGVQDKDMAKIRGALEEGANPNSMIWDEWPCLVRSALFGHEEAVRLLLTKGADISIRAKGGSAAYWAASAGHTELVDLFFDLEDEQGIIPSVGDNDRLLNDAISGGHLGIVERILKRRTVAIDALNRYGVSPLQTAASQGHAKVVELLLERGGLKEVSSVTSAAMLSAASSGHSECVRVLVSKGKAKVNFSGANGETALYYVSRMGGSDDEAQAKGLELARFLLSAGADANNVARDGSPAVNAAVYDRVDLLKLFVEHGADLTKKDGMGYTALTAAIKYTSDKAVDYLLETPIADEKARNAFLEGALQYTARNGKREFMLKILKAGVSNIDCLDWAGKTPLLLATECGHVPTARLLVKRGARQDIPDKDGNLPLFIAATVGYDSLVKELVKASKNPNISDQHGDTPLCLAAANGHLEVVRQLLQNGADAEIANEYGDTPLDIAEEKHFEKIVELLEGVEKL